MYARVVTFTVNKEVWDEAMALVNTEIDQMAAFPGLRSWVIVGNQETGEGTAVAVFENKEALEAVTDQMNQILAGFATYFVSAPSVDVGDVLAYIDNA